MRPKDRLHELQQRAQRAGAAPPASAPATSPPLPPPPQLQEILDEAARARGATLALEGDTQLITRLCAHPAFHTDTNLQAQLEEAAARAGPLGARVCDALARLEAAGGAVAGGVAGRIARLQAAAARLRLAAALARRQAALDALRDTRLQLLHRQLQLANLTISDEECQSLLESNDVSLFVDNVRADTAEARRVLRDVEERRDELARVEAALRDVRDLFRQLACLVATQQARVDSVEYYALQASEHVETGQRQLLRGTVARAGARKKKISLLICVSGGLLVVLAVLVFT